MIFIRHPIKLLCFFLLLKEVPAHKKDGKKGTKKTYGAPKCITGTGAEATAWCNADIFLHCYSDGAKCVWPFSIKFCEGSCTGLEACSGSFPKMIDWHSCNGDNTCTRGFAAIGSQSCNADNACNGMTGTTGNNSCNADLACVGLGGITGVNSCNAQGACDGMAGTSLPDSCNTVNECKDCPTGSCG
jgi:hypothetical protein